jgi:aconitate hydratase
VLKVGDDISTDEILRAGTEVLPFRSNIPAISRFAFDMVDETYPERAEAVRDAGGHAIVGGRNYGQGSSREHAALAPRYLGLRLVIVQEFARIHWQNLANFGVLALRFRDPAGLDAVAQGDVLRVSDVRAQLGAGSDVAVENVTRGTTIAAFHELSERQLEDVLAGGTIERMKARLST